MYQDYSGNYDTSSRGSSTSPAQPESFTSSSSTIGSPISTSSYQVTHGELELTYTCCVRVNMSALGGARSSVQTQTQLVTQQMLFSHYLCLNPITQLMCLKCVESVSNARMCGENVGILRTRAQTTATFSAHGFLCCACRSTSSEIGCPDVTFGYTSCASAPFALKRLVVFAQTSAPWGSI